MSLDQASTPAAGPVSGVSSAAIETAKEGANVKAQEVITPDGAAPEAQKAEEDPKFAARFAALSRREKQILEREKKIKSDEASYQSYKAAVEAAKNDPLNYLQAAGLSYEEVTNYLIGKVDSTKPLSTDEKIAALEKKLEEKERQAQLDAHKKQQADLQAAVDQYKTNIKEHIDSNLDKYELIQANEAHDLVFDVALEHWQNTGGEDGGQILPYDKAAEAVESWLEREVREKILKTKKFARPEPEIKEAAPSGLKSTVQAPTLTNRNTVSATPVKSKNLLMDREDSLRRAASMLKYHK